MSKLVIVESPTKAGTIEKYLGKGYNVRASMGHVRDLYASKLSVDVTNNFAPRYVVIKGKEKLVKELCDLAKESDEVYLATDPDREGEAISWHLATLLNLDLKKTKRVKFNEINKTSVKNGMANPSQIDMDLVNAQQARRILDRLVGYRLSPFISQKIRRGLSAGRVQSVAVRLIVDREDEINNFVPEEYWSITAKFNSPRSRKIFKAAFAGDETGKVKIENKEQSDKYLSRLDGAHYSVDNVKKGVRNKQPAPPFTTSTLQQDASHRLGFTSKRTMKVAQELYEGIDIAGYGSIGLITYMRTDSLRISDESRAEGSEYIKNTFGKQYLPEKPRSYKSKGRTQDGHEAIRPTVPSLTPEQAKASLTSDQYKLYDLIWNRFMASLMANCVQDTIKVEIKAEKENEEGYCIFTASGYEVRFDGFTALYSVNDEEESENNLYEIEKGDALKLKELAPEQHFTQPPARYTEASLIKVLEETGVGRPSTYATIITTITSKAYVVRDRKQLKPTELGIATTKLLKEQFPKIVNTKFTAGMETSLDDVEAGELDYISMLHEFYDEFEATLEKAKDSMAGIKIQLEEDKTDIPCEKCGRNMIIKVGRFGKFLACPAYPECKNTKPYIEHTDGKCPVCNGDVIGKKSKKGYSFFGCSNYPDCKFMTWDTPTNEKCPQCAKTLFKSKGSVLKCLAESCGYQRKIQRSRKQSDSGANDE